jgi:hypothetical protein
MSVPIKLRDDLSAGDVRAHALRCSDGAQVRRLLAIATILSGGSRSDAALIGGVTRQIGKRRRNPALTVAVNLLRSSA